MSDPGQPTCERTAAVVAPPWRALHEEAATVTAYVLAHVDIADRAGFSEYTRRFGPTLAPFGGRVVVVSDAPDVLEGDWPPGRTVVLEFADAATARAWWESDAYQEISQLRRAASTSAMIIAPAWEAPSSA